MNSNGDSLGPSRDPQVSADALRSCLLAVETQLAHLKRAVISLAQEVERVGATQAPQQQSASIMADAVKPGAQPWSVAENSTSRRSSISLIKQPEPAPAEVTEPTRIRDLVSGAPAAAPIAGNYKSTATEFASAPAEIQPPSVISTTERSVLPNPVAACRIQRFPYRPGVWSIFRASSCGSCGRPTLRGNCSSRHSEPSGATDG